MATGVTLPDCCLTADAVGPAVSLDGYPRYAPQWGVRLPEKKKVVPPTPVRKEPSERAKAVMTRPGTPAYPKPGVGGSKAVAGSARAEPSGDLLLLWIPCTQSFGYICL